ncbi:MAG: hypothetical protein ABGX16_16860 [Pirellulales bacterium]
MSKLASELVVPPCEGFTVLEFKRDYLHSSAGLVGAICVFVVSALPFVIWLQGIRGLVELGSAVLVCLSLGLVGLGVSMHCINTRRALQGMLLSMLFRLLPPLTICLLLAIQGTGDDYFGFVCYLLAIYMITLAVETVISVRWISTRT